jgi:hypothetical protein
LDIPSCTDEWVVHFMFPYYQVVDLLLRGFLLREDIRFDCILEDIVFLLDIGVVVDYDAGFDTQSRPKDMMMGVEC